MSYLLSLPHDATLLAVLRAHPASAGPLLAGWDERAVHDAAAVCGLFNLMNRLVDGLGVSVDPDYFALSARRLADGGYARLRSLLGETL